MFLGFRVLKGEWASEYGDASRGVHSDHDRDPLRFKRQEGLG